MKKNFGIVLAIALGLSALLLTIAFQAGWVRANPSSQLDRVEVGALISYQGQIQDDGAPITGMGHFKFAIVDGTGSTTYWSNDGTSVAGSEPTNAVPLGINSGMFNVNLGDTSGTYSNMTQIIGPNTFSEYPTLLRVWFSPDGVTFTPMPDQKVTVVPYALQAVESVFAWNADTANSATIAGSATTAGYASEAGRADTADLFDGLNASWFQKRVEGTCAVGKAVTAVNSDGSVVCSSTFQYRVSGACAEDEAVRYINADGSVVCSSALQLQITGTCPIGQAIRYINADGSVTCETIPPTPEFVIDIKATTGNMGSHSSIALGSDGLGIISFYDLTNGFLRAFHCSNINCSSGTYLSVDTGANVGQYNDIIIGNDGLPLISYYDATNTALKIAHCSDIYCSSRSITVLDSVGDVGKNSSITIAGNGFGLIVYEDTTNSDIKAAYCRNIDCSDYAINVVVSSVNDLGDPSIALGTDFLGVISYIDNTNLKMYIIKCSRNDCSTSTSIDSIGAFSSIYDPNVVIERDGNIGISFVRDSMLHFAYCYDNFGWACYDTELASLWTPRNHSLVIGADGLPIISYSGGLDNLKVIHCYSPECRDENTSADITISTLDSLGHVGEYSSITIGSDGLPLISYFDSDNLDLKSAHCSNELCLPIGLGQ